MDPQAGHGSPQRGSGFFHELTDALCDAVGQLAAKGAPEIAPAGQHLWDWFWDIHRGRSSGLGGWLPLSASEMQAWASLTGNIVTLREWQMLRDMDSAFLEAAGKRQNDGGDIPQHAAPKPGEGRDISASAFDAVFG